MLTETESAASRVTEVAPFLRALLVAQKNIQLYPVRSRTVADGLATAITECGKATALGPLSIDVRHNSLAVERTPVPDPDGRYGRCAKDWYRRGVGTITFHPAADVEALHAVLTTLTRPVDELLATGGPAAQPTLADLEHITVTHGTDVTIMTAAPGAMAFAELARQAEDIAVYEGLDDPAGADSFFLGVAERDPERLAALQALLAAPQRLTLLFQAFALRVREHQGTDDGLLVTQLMQIILAAEEIVTDLPDDGAQQRLYRGLADMIRGLPGDVEHSVLTKGLLPDVVAGGLAAKVMRLFPVPDIANALARGIIEDGQMLDTLAETVGGLHLDEGDRELLGILTHGRLEAAGEMTPEMHHLFTDVVFGALPDSTDAPVRGTERMLVRLSADSPLTEDDVVWHQHEYRKARREARRAALKSADLDLLPLLAEFIQIEKRPADFADLAARSAGAIMGFLDREHYAAAVELLRVLQTQRDDRAGTFTPGQVERLDTAFATLVSIPIVTQLLRAYDAAASESIEARQIMQFFRALGEPVLTHMVAQLAEEDSRHMRLLLCRSVAKLGEGRTSFLARCLDHPQWFVARNVMTIAAEMADVDALPLAFRAVRHAEPRVVREALKTLAKIRTPEAVGAIIATLRAPDSTMQAAAAAWLGIIGGTDALHALGALVQAHAEGGNQDVLLAAVEALGRIGTPAARALLQPLSRPGPLFSRRRRAAVREAAIAALHARGHRT